MDRSHQPRRERDSFGTASLRVGSRWVASPTGHGCDRLQRCSMQVHRRDRAADLVLAAEGPWPVGFGSRGPNMPVSGRTALAFEEADAIYGGTGDTDDVIDRLRAGERELYVIGRSGSGKSSLVMAGVLPRLARGVAGLYSAIETNKGDPSVTMPNFP